MEKPPLLSLHNSDLFVCEVIKLVNEVVDFLVPNFVKFIDEAIDLSVGDGVSALWSTPLLNISS